MLTSKLRKWITATCNITRSSSSAAADLDSPTPWSLEIRSAADLRRFRHVLTLYAHVHRSGHRPDPFSIAAALKACVQIPSPPSAATAIHCHVIKYGHQSHLYPQSALINVYSKLSSVQDAQRLFDEMTVRNAVSWNSIISSYLRAGELEVARTLFDEMPVKDAVSWNSMISGYAKAGDLGRAAELFQCMPEKNSAHWNGMISGYINHGDMGSARGLFDRMPVKSNVSWIAMISGYARLGDVSSARELFETMEERDLFSWNAMIACYSQNGCPREALRSFNSMHVVDGIQPDKMTFSCVISACSKLGDLRYGSWAEDYARGLGVEFDDHLRTALIDLHSKCGGMDKAFELFGCLTKRDLVAYSAMILGYGLNGNSRDAVGLFEEMLAAKVAPNKVTFIGLLAAYNHAGLVDEGRRCLDSMLGEHGVSPSADHYAIVVDLLGRSGRLDEAHELIKEMPVQPHGGVWGALLLACRLHGNAELAEIAGQRCFALEPEGGGHYVLLANIYKEAGKLDKASRLMAVMAEKGLMKSLGCSWVQPR